MQYTASVVAPRRLDLSLPGVREPDNPLALTCTFTKLTRGFGVRCSRWDGVVRFPSTCGYPPSFPSTGPQVTIMR